MEWISVAERLPESEGDYLVVNELGDIGVSNFWGIPDWDNNDKICDWRWTRPHDLWYGDPTYWMPIPAPPMPAT